MWQDFKDFITIDNLHIFCFWFLIILTVVGLIEIIYQIRNAVRKINIADEYIKHIDIIQRHLYTLMYQPENRMSYLQI